MRWFGPLLLLAACPVGPGSDVQPADSSPDSGSPAAEWPDGVKATWLCGGEAASFSADAPAFAEATSAWGLDDVRGVTFISPDLNGDGYADLIAVDNPSNVRDSVGNADPASDKYYHRVLLNVAAGGQRTFSDVTVESGLITNAEGTLGTSHSWYQAGDVDGDGDLDIFAGRYQSESEVDATGDRNALYINDGTGHFTMAQESGLENSDVYPSAGAAFTDVDLDGDADLFLVGWYTDYGLSSDGAQPQLYLNDGSGTFTNVTEGSGLELKSAERNYTERGRRRPGFGATACDVTGDGKPELLQAGYGRAWNLMFTQEGDIWVEVGEAANYDMDDGVDYTDNLWYACYCEGRACDPEPTESCGGAFPSNYWTVGYDDQDARLGGNTFGTMCGDLDNDGDLDLYNTEIAHAWAGDSSDPSQVLENDGTGIFTRIPNEDNGMARERPRLRDWNEGDLYGAFFDFDNDGWKDILVVSTDYPDTQLWTWQNLGGGQYAEVSDATGLNQEWPNGAAIADFDLDGDLDLVTGSSNARSGSPWAEHYAHFYENGLGGSALRISGLPVGAKVEVTQGATVQTFEVAGGYGHWGMFHDRTQHVGLAGRCSVDSLTITLPGGGTTSFGALSAP